MSHRRWHLRCRPPPRMRETKSSSQLRLSDLMVLVALLGTLLGGLLTL